MTGRAWKSLEDAIAGRIIPISTGCALWSGGLGQSGYGQLKFQGRKLRVSRAVWECAHGPIPEDLTIDHTCGCPPCGLLDHLELVSISTNVLRSGGPGAENARKTHCKQGHPLSGDNLYPTKDGRRQCRTCRVIWQMEHAERRRNGISLRLSGYCKSGHLMTPETTYADRRGRTQCRICNARRRNKTGAAERAFWKQFREEQFALIGWQEAA